MLGRLVKESAPKAGHHYGAIVGYSSRLFSSSVQAETETKEAPSIVTVTQHPHKNPQEKQRQNQHQHQQSEGGGGAVRRKRHRHRFNNFTDEIPSFQEFQQQQQVRSLYRKFTRLVFQKASSTRIDLQQQIRHEFRLTQSDAWHVKRSLSEGNRKYKELTAMLGSSVVLSSGANDNENVNSESGLPKEASVPAPSTSNWPWNRSSSNGGDAHGAPPRPIPFPPKSNL